MSLYEEADREAQRHKWIESERHGRDLGETAIRDWYRRHWPRYCRHKRLEHIRGMKLWREFGDEAFGCLYSLIVTGDLLADRILDRIDAGYENLCIINWAVEWGLPTDRVVDILQQIDVNRARLEPAL
ncbi:MAG TPA: hypothetical protein VF170_18035 [Planctomycetaceae bacterium]